jgi:protocatechuate 3,4-dioxygenase beta subunit
MMTLTRRQALGVLGVAGAASFVRLGSGARALAATCTATLDKTEGPFFVDELLQRSDIRVDPSDGSTQPGVPLRLTINVLRSDADCAAASGVQIDVWHANADGLYSDEASNGTSGQMFLRGYQVSDAAGAVTFTTIYPGWYTGRTVHIHLKARVFSGGQPTYEFTSQLFFDDAVSNQVFAQAPYASRGAQDTTNAEDSIYGGTSALLVPLTSDGSGGYTGTFDLGLAGLPATTGGSCSDLATCRAAVTAALPDPTTAADRKARRVARRLVRLDARANAALDRAGSASGTKQSRPYAKARATLERVVTIATAADAEGNLDVDLATLEDAVTALLALVPA